MLPETKKFIKKVRGVWCKGEKKMKLSEYLQGSNNEEKVCKNCQYIMRPIREDLEDEYFSCMNPKIGKMVKLSDSCTEYSIFNNNLANLL
jgi:hypothetical protein